MRREEALSDRNIPTPLDVPLAFDDPPSPNFDRALLDGIVRKRVIAYIVDLIAIGILLFGLTIVASIVGVLSFGLLAPPLFAALALVPLAYHTLLLGGPASATFGMRMMDIELRTWDGQRPGYIQAAAQTAVFYVSISLLWLIPLVVVFFNDKRRTVHDMMCGTIMINSAPRVDHVP